MHPPQRLATVDDPQVLRAAALHRRLDEPARAARDGPCDSDEARSLVLTQVPPGTRIEVYGTTIEVKRDNGLDGKVSCVRIVR